MKNEACDKKATLKVSEYLLKILRKEGIKNLGTYQDLYDFNENDNMYYTKFKYKNAYFTVYHQNENYHFASGYFNAVCWLDENIQDEIYYLGYVMIDEMTERDKKKKAAKWHKNYIIEKNGSKKLEWIAYNETKTARINRTWENTVLLEKQEKNNDIYEDAGVMAFDTIKEAKKEAAKWFIE